MITTVNENNAHHACNNVNNSISKKNNYTNREISKNNITRNSVITNVDRIVVKPVKPQEKEATVNQLKSDIDVIKLGVNVKKFRSQPNGHVVIDIEKESDKLKLTNEIQNRFGNVYQVKSIVKKLPKFKIVSLDNNVLRLSDNEIIASVIQQNEWIKENIDDPVSNDMKIIKKYTTTENKGSIIMQTSLRRHELITSRGKIRFAKYCYREEVCRRCAENHHERDCKSEDLKCVNYIKAVNKYNLEGIACDHSATLLKCSSYIKLLNQRQSNTLYADKIDEVSKILNEMKPEILCLSKTHTTDDILDYEMSFSNYNMVRTNTKNSRTGEVVTYLKKDIKFKVTLNSDELINGSWLNCVQIHDGHEKLIVCNIYRSPSSSINTFCDHFVRFAETLVDIVDEIGSNICSNSYTETEYDFVTLRKWEIFDRVGYNMIDKVIKELDCKKGSKNEINAKLVKLIWKELLPQEPPHRQPLAHGPPHHGLFSQAATYWQSLAQEPPHHELLEQAPVQQEPQQQLAPEHRQPLEQALPTEEFLQHQPAPEHGQQLEKAFPTEEPLQQSVPEHRQPLDQAPPPEELQQQPAPEHGQPLEQALLTEKPFQHQPAPEHGQPLEQAFPIEEPLQQQPVPEHRQPVEQAPPLEERQQQRAPLDPLVLVDPIDSDDSDDSRPASPVPARINFEQDPLLYNECSRPGPCSICLINERDILFLPCNHAVIYVECSNTMSRNILLTCPICRAPIRQKIFINFS
ncbi:hypothetical protein KQX54_013615 [Cotesia glomerata]|uniref:RING-type domain-containing protein n=1 Tax=Cotesia glomerata TaxID=32391 RepID=A0AAV7IWS8_COTGL|nr:hypothetical protein KQX54_013615 [Cotesia glomerata]